jgi:methionine--tRNA ligase beta chain
VNQYDRLFTTDEPGKESGDYLQDLNPDSLQVVKNVIVEPSVATDAEEMLAKIRDSKDKVYASNLSYQFERSGYFALDQASKDDGELIFNRVVTLRDTWGGEAQEQKGKQQQKQRSRGGDNNNSRQPKKPAGGAGTVEDLRRVALRAVTILEAGPHPEADSLLLLKVDCGDVGEDGEATEPRTVVAGLAGKIPAEELIGKKVVAVTNLKPAKMRGIESHAMLLAASDGNEEDEKVELLSVPDSVPNGELLSFEGKDASEPDGMLKSKGAQKVWDRVKAGFQANGDGEATYSLEGNTHRMMTSAGPVSTTSLQNADIQ